MHMDDEKYINGFMAEIAKHVYPDFTVLDGTVGMQGKGPGGGDPIDSQFALSSYNALAIDSVTTQLMGFDVKDVGYLNLISRNRSEPLYPDDSIEIIGEKFEELAIEFEKHPDFEQKRHWEDFEK